jgi:hypothetical protein
MMSRMAERPALRGLIALLLLTVLLAACSSAPAATSSRPSPARYVAGVCKAVLAWKDLLDIRSSSFISETSSVETVDGHRLLASYLDDVSRDAEAVIGEVRGVGLPDMTSGPAVQERLLELLAEVRSTIAQVRAGESQLAPKGPAAFVGPIQASAGSNVKGVRATLQGSGNPEAQLTIATNRNCKDLFEKPPVDLGA